MQTWACGDATLPDLAHSAESMCRSLTLLITDIIPADTSVLHVCSQVRFAHMLPGVEAFDARALGMDGTEAEFMDPHQRLMLECIAEADLAQRPSATTVFCVKKAGRVRLDLILVVAALLPHTLGNTAGSSSAGSLPWSRRAAISSSSLHHALCMVHCYENNRDLHDIVRAVMRSAEPTWDARGQTTHLCCRRRMA